ncbi:MAG: c-type cytochrome [Anaerolineales bacterium]|jgi:mono/diheme cytochrome c family protein
MKWHIALGSIAILFTLAVLAIVGINEPQRMQAFTVAYESRRIEEGAALFENNCRTCHGPQGRGIPGVAPAINTASLFNGDRLAEVGFSGTIEDYVQGVIAAGRPVPSAGTSYPQRMPTWGQEFGGPLRADQVDSLVAFVLNWEEEALAEAEGETPAAAQGEPVGTDIAVELPEGNPETGAELSQESAVGCAACHELSAVGPAWAGGGDQPGVGARAEQRIQAEDYTGEATTAREYLVESIVRTNAYVVDGFEANIMPGDYGQRLTPQQVADLIAYMQTLR